MICTSGFESGGLLSRSVNALRESRVHSGLLFHWSNNAPPALYPLFPTYHSDPKAPWYTPIESQTP